MEDIAVEVCGEDDALYKAYILDVFEEEALVQFEDGWQPDSKFAYSRLKFPPEVDTKAEFLENQEVEVYSAGTTTTLLVISIKEDCQKKSEILTTMHLRSLQQKVLLLKRTEEAARQLHSTKLTLLGG